MRADTCSSGQKATTVVHRINGINDTATMLRCVIFCQAARGAFFAQTAKNAS
ncbi:MAG: hypothetical protein H7834_01995 [Magnetococcus sp. YQC-9]